MLDMTNHRGEDGAPEPLFYLFRQDSSAWYEKLDASASAKCAIIPHKLRSDDVQLERISFFDGLEDWNAFRITIPEDKLTRFFSGFMCAKKPEEPIPDILNVSHKLVVSDRVREIVEDVEPRETTWAPIILSFPDGSVLSRYRMCPIRLFRTRSAPVGDLRADYLFPDSEKRLLYAAQNNPDLRCYFEALHIWGGLVEPENPIFSPHLFRRLVDGGVTGLVERTDPTPMGSMRPIEETVVHVWR